MPAFVRPLNLKKPVVNRKLIAWGFILTGLISIGSWAWGRTRPAPGKVDRDSWWGAVKISYPVTAPSPTPVGGKVLAGLQSQLATASGEYSIYVYRLVDKQGYGLNSDRVLPAASIMKVPIMVAGYRKVEDGSLKLEETRNLLEAMGKRSDNDAPAALINMIGRPFMRQTVADLDMAATDFDQNTTTAYDVAVMWKNLYEGKILAPEHWQQLQEFLTDSIFEERIPAGVPDGIRVIHKVGTDLDVWADAGIVFAARPVVIVVLNDQVRLEEAKELVPNLVETIYRAETVGQ